MVYDKVFFFLMSPEDFKKLVILPKKKFKKLKYEKLNLQIIVL